MHPIIDYFPTTACPIVFYSLHAYYDEIGLKKAKSNIDIDLLYIDNMLDSWLLCYVNKIVIDICFLCNGTVN